MRHAIFPARLLILLLALTLPMDAVRAQDIPELGAAPITEFARGMEAYEAQRYAAALPYFYRAHELDNRFVLPLFFAALCEGNRGSTVPRDSLLKIVLAEKARLSPYYAHRAESYLAKITGDRENALKHNRLAAQLSPGSKAWYNLALDLNQANRPLEARSLLMHLDPNVEPMKGWPDYHTVLARANDALGRYAEVLRNADDLQEAFPESRVPFWWRVNAYGAMGDADGLNRVFQEAAATPATGNGNTVGAFITLAAAELKAHGHPGAGLEMYNRAARWYEERGEEVSGHLHQRWHILALMGAERLQEGLDICDDILAQRPQDVWQHSVAGTLAGRMGNMNRFQSEKDWLVDVSASRVPPWLPAYMAYYHAAEGKAEEAVASLENAMEQGWSFSPWWHRDPTFDLVRDHPSFQEFIRPKG